ARLAARRCCENKPERGETRGRQVDEIVETRRRPAEIEMARVLVADHRIGGVGRLVGDAARQAGDGEPERGSDDAVGKVLRETLDRRACDPRFVERARIAPDNARNREPPGFDAAALQRLGDAHDMGVKTALRRQRGGERRERGHSQAALGQQGLQQRGRRDGDREQPDQRSEAAETATQRRTEIQAPIARLDGPALPCDRMAYRLEQDIGISSDRLDGERRRREREVLDGTVGREDWHVTMGPLRESRRAAIERLFQHGGDIKAATVAYPDAPRPWIDLSTGLNPVAYPVPELPRELWARLPETAALDALRAAAGLFYGVEPECVAAGAGSQAVLQVLPRLFPAPRVSILGPTYGEHERVWKTSGADTETVGDLDAATAPQVVVVNPNNPDGRMFARLRMADTARRLADEGRRLIVDEAFMDFESESVAGDRLAATIVLRSFGKAFGLSGLRLGFAVAPPAIAARIREALGPWP